MRESARGRGPARRKVKGTGMGVRDDGGAEGPTATGEEEMAAVTKKVGLTGVMGPERVGTKRSEDLTVGVGQKPSA